MNASYYIIIILLFSFSRWFSSTRALPTLHSDEERTYQQVVQSEDLPKTSPEVTSAPLGLTWDGCQDDADCLAPRTCMLYLNGKESKKCKDETGCVCDTSHNVLCLLDKECHPREYCLIPFEGSIGACFSKTGGNQRERITSAVSSSPTPELPLEGFGGSASGVSSQGSGQGKNDGREEGNSQGRFCIGVNVLRNMSREALLYKKNVEALVLCDKFDSCATAGHMVVFKGRVMMMKSYCAMVGCVEKIMLVNNPRFRSARVAGFTKGLVFTAYSARYGTRVEEMLFRMLTSSGL